MDFLHTLLFGNLFGKCMGETIKKLQLSRYPFSHNESRHELLNLAFLFSSAEIQKRFCKKFWIVFFHPRTLSSVFFTSCSLTFS